MLRYFCLLLFVAVLAPAQTLQPGATLPQIKGTTLDEQEIILPDAVTGKITLLIITFSKTGGERGRAWNDRFFKDYPQDPKVTSYAIAMLQDVPSLFRGMVRGGIKRGLPAFMRRRFLTVTKDEDDWKRYVGLQDDKDAYLILLDIKGWVQWSRHGQFDQAVYDSLKATITQMLSQKTS